VRLLPKNKIVFAVDVGEELVLSVWTMATLLLSYYFARTQLSKAKLGFV
jgi:hypothetical protein